MDPIPDAAEALGGRLYSPTSIAENKLQAGAAVAAEDKQYSPTSPPDAPTVTATAGSMPAATAASAPDVDSKPQPVAVAPAVESPDHSPLLGREGLVPRLWMGSSLGKSVDLKPDRWLKIGRGDNCHLRLPNNGVSQSHCALLWDTFRRVVEFRDTSQVGTLVNGVSVKGRVRTLKHSDLVRVLGKGVQYDFVLDLRPVRLGFGDPVQEVRQKLNSSQASQLTGVSLAKRKDTLGAQLQHLEESIQRSEARGFELEQQYYDILARRKKRIADDKQRNEQLLNYERGAAALEARLKESREEWAAKLQLLYDSNQDAEVPLVEDAKLMKDKYEKMRMKKDEIVRSQNPELFMLQSALDQSDSEDDRLPQLEASAAAAGAPVEDSDGEDEAFLDDGRPRPGAAAAEEEAAGGAASGATSSGAATSGAAAEGSAAAEAKAAAAKVTEEDPMADLFGDFESADEAEVARDAALEAAPGGEVGAEPVAKRLRAAEG